MCKTERVDVNTPRQELSYLSLKDFKHDTNLGIGTPVLIIVKGTDQFERAHRLLETFNSNRTFVGRTETRLFTKGYIFATQLDKEIQEIDRNWWCRELTEPKFVDFHSSQMAITTSENVKIVNLNDGTENCISHPYFGSLHSAVFSHAGNQLLVASNGFDSVMEMDTVHKSESWRWTAWEHGYDFSPAGIFITTDRISAQQHEATGEKVILIEDPSRFGHFGLPTGYRTTHVNEAMYDYENPDGVICTLFHQGTVIKISKKTGETTILASGFKSPHGFKKLSPGYMVTDTRNGYWYRFNDRLLPIERVSFREMPGKSSEMAELEWIQYTWPINDSLFLAVDSNRAQAVFFDPYRKIYNIIALNPTWSVQSIKPIDLHTLLQLKQLNYEN